MTTRTDERSIPDLLRELSNEGGELVRKEIALAKAEMRETVDHVQENAATVGIGFALLLAALMLLLWAANLGVTALLAEVVEAETAVWLSPVLLGLLLAAIGAGMIRSGRKAIGDTDVVPRRTKETLAEDQRWARNKARDIKEDLNHG